MDEVGSNISQTKDGAIGGQTYLCKKTGHVQERATTKDAHFTLLGFTAVEPNICAIFFAVKSMKKEWADGFDPVVEWISEENDVHQNVRAGKALPKGQE